MTDQIAIIGFGNIASAIVTPLLDNKLIQPEFLILKWREIQELKNISITGLMTINPKGLSSKENSGLFKKCRALADSLQLPDCSMGMSGDWEEAIDAGSTCLLLHI